MRYLIINTLNFNIWFVWVSWIGLIVYKLLLVGL